MTNTTTYVNLTQHEINLNDGRSFAPSGVVARVESSTLQINEDICNVIYGDLLGVPEPKDGVKYIVSAMVLNGTNRVDIVAPATTHKLTKRNERGHIISVPCFVANRVK